MLAILALSSLALEERVAFMAGPAHPLRWSFPGHFFPGCAMDHGERASLLAWPVIGNAASDGKSFALGSAGVCSRKARALLAACVLTIAADLVCTERSLASMAGAVDPHANLLLHSWYSYSGRHCPLSGLQCQSILGEESASLLFL